MWNEPDKERLNRIPKLYETEHIPIKDKLVHLHFFIGSCDWFIMEYDGQDLFWGFAILNGDLEMAEFGYISFNDLKSIRLKSGVEIDCEIELFWRIRPAREIDLISKAQGWHLQSHENQYGR